MLPKMIYNYTDVCLVCLEALSHTQHRKMFRIIVYFTHTRTHTFYIHLERDRSEKEREEEGKREGECKRKKREK